MELSIVDLCERIDKSNVDRHAALSVVSLGVIPGDRRSRAFGVERGCGFGSHFFRKIMNQAIPLVPYSTPFFPPYKQVSV